MVRRTRVIDVIAHGLLRNWLIEAGAGYGKSVLVNALRSAMPDPLLLVRQAGVQNNLSAFFNELAEAARRAGIAGLSEELSGAEDSIPRVAQALMKSRCSLALDDVHGWDDPVGIAIGKLSRELDAAPNSVVLLVGRGLPDSLVTARTDPAWGILGPEQLGLTANEVAEMLQAEAIHDPTIASSLHRVSGGWPLAVAAFCSRLRSDPTSAPAELARYDVLTDRLMHGYLDEVSDADLTAGRTLATLPFFDDRVAELVGSAGLLTRLAAAGVPLTRQADGWTELSEQFRASLIRSPRATPTPAIDPAITDYFVARGEIQAAITACLAVGDNPAAATIIANVNYTQESQLDLTTLNAAMTTIGDTADQVPRSLLVQASVNVSNGQFAEGLVAIERAAASADHVDPQLTDPVHQEILLELGVWRHFSGADAEANQLMQRCRAAQAAAQGDGSPIAEANRARLLDLQGLLNTRTTSLENLETARLQMTEALAIWRRLQEPRAAAVTVMRLVSDVLIELGRRHEAMALLDNLPSIGPMTLVNRARVQLLRSQVLPHLGRGSDVAEAVEDARRIAALLGQDWLIGMADASEAVAASMRGDGDRVNAICDEIESNPDRFRIEADSGYSWCLLAEALVRVENYERAELALARAQQSDGVDGANYEFARVALLAHAGDPQEASTALEELLADGSVSPGRRWSVALLRSLASSRAGDVQRSQQFLEESFQEAAALDQGTLPRIVERRILERLEGGGDPPPAPDGSASAPVVEVSLFDEFRVDVNGTQIEIPGGQITDLVKLLVLSGGRLVVDQVIDQLWPDADLTVGRPRLRNVLKRLRKVSDQLIERSGDALVLAGQVDSDFARAGRAARAAMSSSASLAQVSEAVRLGSHTLLPDDLYADWAEHARRSHRSQLVRLLDKQAELAERADDIDLAVTALEAAHEADGIDGVRLGHGARLLQSVGRNAAADALLRRHSSIVD